MGQPNSSYVVTTPISLEFNDAYATVEEKVLHTGADPKTELDQLQTEFEPKLQAALK
jgi:hypothetical protein